MVSVAGSLLKPCIMIDVFNRRHRLYLEKLVFLLILLKQAFAVEWQHSASLNAALKAYVLMDIGNESDQVS